MTLKPARRFLCLLFALGLVSLAPQTAAQDEIVFRDEFTNTMSPSWTILHRDDTYWKLTPTNLSVRASAGDIVSNRTDYRNLFLIDTPTTADSFNVTVRVRFQTPDDACDPLFHLVVYDDDDNLLRSIYIKICWLSERFLEFGAEIGGGWESSYESHDFGSNPFYFRLEKRGNTYWQSYSLDGDVFTISNHPILFGDGTPSKVGFGAWLDSSESSVAYLEYFEVRAPKSYVETQTSLVGTWAHTNAPVRKIASSGTRAVAIAGDSDVHLLDLSNPAAPVTLGSWSTVLLLSDAWLVGNFAYVASWELDFLSTVEIVDFTDPAKPVKLGYYDTPGYAQELLVRNNLAYVADAEGGMSILDVGDPVWPRRLGGYDTKGSIQHVEVSGSYAYVSDGNWLTILNVSDPANPLRVGLYEVAGGISSLKAYVTKLYVSEGTGGVRILDVSNPASIQLLGTYQGWGNPAQAMALSGKYLYLAKGTGGLHVLDVNDPAKPTYLTGAWTSPAEDVVLMGKYAVVAGADKGLMVYEVQQRLYPPLPAPVIFGNTITLTWATTNDVRLQKAANLVNPVWQDVPESEGTNTLTLPMTEAKSFFRLVKGPKPGQPIPPPPGMVAWWSGDGNALDLVGTNHGTLMNGATFAPGMVGQAFLFDGNDDFVLVLDSPHLAFHDNTPMSVELWAYRMSSALEQHLLGIHTHGVGLSYQLAIDGEGVRFVGSYPHDAGLSSHFDPPLNEWLHYAATFDGAEIRLYINAVLAAAAISPLGPQLNESLRIGASPHDLYRTFGGMIDEVSIYNRALSPEEIKAIYDAGSAAKIKPPL